MTDPEREGPRRQSDRREAKTLLLRYSLAVMFGTAIVVGYFVQPVIDHVIGKVKDTGVDWDFAIFAGAMLVGIGIVTFPETRGFFADLGNVVSWKKGQKEDDK